MEGVGIFYGHLAYFPEIWHTSWLFGIFYPILVHFTRFGMLYQEKSGNPGSNPFSRKKSVEIKARLLRENEWMELFTTKKCRPKSFCSRYGESQP
jgi:hypothetical protein